MTLRRQLSSLAMMSAIRRCGRVHADHGDELFNPHDGPPGPPPLTPEQIKAQEKRARKAAKWAREAERQQPITSRAATKLSNFGYPIGLGRLSKQTQE